MAVITIDNTEVIRCPRTIIYRRKYWTDAWQEDPNLYALDLERTCGPDISRASFEHFYGRVMPHGETTWRVLEPQRLERQYVWFRIVLADPIPEDVENEIEAVPGVYIDWVGIVAHESQFGPGQVARDDGDGDVTSQIGIQRFECVGWEALLAQSRIVNSINRVAYSSGGSTVDDLYTVPFAPAFNSLDGRTLAFNGGSSTDAQNVFSGVGGLGQAATIQTGWHGNRILEYLRRVAFIPDTNIPLWQTENDLVRADQASSLNDTFRNVIVHQEGRSLKDVIDRICDRRRLYGWTIRYDADEDVNILSVFTHTPEDIGVDETDAGAVIAANPPDTLDLTAAADANQQWTYSATNHYTSVVALGGLRTGTCTIGRRATSGHSETAASFPASDAEYIYGGWRNSIDTHYKTPTAANASLGIAATSTTGLEIWEKSELHGKLRSSPIFQDLFELYRLSPWWDGHALLTDDTGFNPVMPQFNEDGTPNTVSDPADAWMWNQLRILPQTRLSPSYDYRWDGEGSSVPPLMPNIGGTTMGFGRSDYFRPMVFVPDPPREEDGDETWSLGDQVAGAAFPGPVFGDTRTWTVSLAPSPDTPEFRLIVSGAPRHALASVQTFGTGSVHWLDGQREASFAIPPGGFRDWMTLRLTVTLITGERVRVQYPPDSEPVETDPWEQPPGGILDDSASTTLYLDLPEIQLDWIANDTWVGIEGGQPVKNEVGRFIVDDRPKMERIAKAAYEYYSRTRRRFDLQLSRITDELKIGQMIGEVVTVNDNDPEGEPETVEVNTVITSIAYDFTTQTMRVATDHAELDVASVIR